MTNIEIRNARIETLKEKGATVENYKTLVIVRDFRNEDRPTVIIWRGKAMNPFINYYYPRGIESAERSITENKKSEDIREEMKASRRAKRKELTNESIEIGTIFFSSWGYEQTNVNFYQVIGKKGKQTLVIREIASQGVEAYGSMSGTVTAIKDAFTGEEFEVRMTHKDSVKVGHTWASVWDGKPKYESSYA